MAMTFPRNLGFVVLGVWLILYSLVGLVSLALPIPLLSGVALMAGILILAGR